MPVMEELQQTYPEAAPPPTETQPVLQLAPHGSRIAGAIQDPTVTVIENPKLQGQWGYLFSKVFIEKREIRAFHAAYHFRVSTKRRWTGRWKVAVTGFRVVTLEKGFDRGIAYEFMLGDGGAVLPNPSVIGYATCFLRPDEYDRFLEFLLANKDIARTIKELNGALARSASAFELDAKDRLMLPENYASLVVATPGP
jgi:hypothetical protein